MKAALCTVDAQTCQPPTADFVPGTEHLFVFDVDPMTTKLSVDCKALASFPTLAQLVTNSDVDVELGHSDGNPFDGEVDDVLVWFTPP
jgi:hypothetical protein